MKPWAQDDLPPAARAEYDASLRSNMARLAIEEAASTAQRYFDACDRWHMECALEGVDPETEREFYQIDELKSLALAAANRAAAFTIDSARPVRVRGGST